MAVRTTTWPMNFFYMKSLTTQKIRELPSCFPWNQKTRNELDWRGEKTTQKGVADRNNEFLVQVT